MNEILIWSAIFVGVFGISDIVLKKYKINYIDGPVLTAVYFLLSSLLVGSYYYEKIESYLNSLNGRLLFIPLISLVSSIFIYPLLDDKLPIPNKFADKHKTSMFLRMDYKYLTSKLTDIIFQDLMVLILIMILVQKGYSLMSMTGIFLVVFPLIHAPILLSRDRVGTFFVAGSFLGFLLPFVVLIIPSGIFYVVAFHLFIYTLGRFGFGLYFKRKI